MSNPVKYGDEWKLTVRNNPNDSAMPPAAAIRVHRPRRVPTPIATSPMAITIPTAVET